jgi:ubiquinone/menaquinone biosynthesis C-methylase UbiE
MYAAVDAVLSVAPWLRPSVEKLAWRIFYELVSLRSDEDAPMLVGGGFNYGFAGPDETTPGNGDAKFGLALYAAVVGAADVSGRDVIEVGCGSGEGSAFVFERYAPRSLTGVDIAHAAIQRCRRRHGRPGLTFATGDAENLSFPPASVDAVINVESSHCYPHMARFLREVHRVLRPGGLLLFTDFRPTTSSQSEAVPKDDIPELRRQLAESGLRTLDEQDITAEVVRALSLATPVVRAHIERRVPRALRRDAIEYSGVEGSTRFRDFADGRLTYLKLALQKA